MDSFCSVATCKAKIESAVIQPCSYDRSMVRANSALSSPKASPARTPRSKTTPRAPRTTAASSSSRAAPPLADEASAVAVASPKL